MLPLDGKMHFSALKHIAKSPAHYAYNCDTQRKDTESFRIGRALHALVLQGIEPVVYDAERKGKKWIAFKDQMKSLDVKSEDILSKTESALVQKMAQSVLSNPDASSLLNDCHNREVELNWTRDGIECAGRVDAYSDIALIELKSCSCANPRKFLWEAHKFAYHAQMAWYDIALGTEFKQYGTQWRDQYIIAVEKEAPYTCVVYKLDNLRIDQGHTLCEEWLEKYKECEATGIWPSYVMDQPVLWDAEIIIEEEED